MMVSEASYALIHFLNKKQELRERERRGQF